VLRGRDSDAEIGCWRVVLPPVEFYYSGEAGTGEQVAVAERSDGEWFAFLRKQAQRLQVTMIVVVMAEQDEVDFRQIVKRNSRCVRAGRA